MEHVEKFAEDRSAYNTTFKQAFVKLCDLGTDNLTDVEEFLHDDPRSKLRFP